MGKPNCDLTILNISTGGPPPQGKYRGGGYRGTAVRIPEKGSMLDDEKVLLPHQSRAIPSHGRGPGKTNRGAGRTLKMTSPRWGSHPSVGTTGGGARWTSNREIYSGIGTETSCRQIRRTLSYGIRKYEDADQRVHTGEEVGKGKMGRFGKYGATDFMIRYNTGGSYLDHNDTPPKREGII